MIDFETEVRERLDRAATDVAASPDLLAVVERRIVAQRRRATALRVAGAVVVVALAAGLALVATGGDGAEDGTTFATDPSPSPPTTTGATRPGGTWRPMAVAPVEGRFQHLTLAMGDEVLVYGGYGFAETLTDGAVYDVGTDTWRTIPEPPELGSSAVGVWTGEEAIVITGSAEGESGPRQAAAFDPATDTWTPLAAPPDGAVANAVVRAVWTGSEVVLLDGSSERPGGEVLVYDPATDSWRQGAAPTSFLPAFASSAWTGSEVVVAGYDAPTDQPATVNGDTDGDGNDQDPGDPPDLPVSPTAGETVVLAYDPAADSWRSIPWGLDAGRRDSPYAVWAGTRLLVGGGVLYEGGDMDVRRDAALVDPARGTWTPVADAPIGFEGGGRGPDVWTGSVAVVFGGDEDELVPATFDPVAGTWAQGEALPGEVPADSTPVAAGGAVVIALGGHMDVEEEDEQGEASVMGCCERGPAGGWVYVP